MDRDVSRSPASAMHSLDDMAKISPSRDRKQQAAERLATTGRPRVRHGARANVRSTATSAPAPRRKRD